MQQWLFLMTQTRFPMKDQSDNTFDEKVMFFSPHVNRRDLHKNKQKKRIRVIRPIVSCRATRWKWATKRTANSVLIAWTWRCKKPIHNFYSQPSFIIKLPQRVFWNFTCRYQCFERHPLSHLVWSIASLYLIRNRNAPSECQASVCMWLSLRNDLHNPFSPTINQQSYE